MKFFRFSTILFALNLTYLLSMEFPGLVNDFFGSAKNVGVSHAADSAKKSQGSSKKTKAKNKSKATQPDEGGDKKEKEDEEKKEEKEEGDDKKEKDCCKKPKYDPLEDEIKEINKKECQEKELEEARKKEEECGKKSVITKDDKPCKGNKVPVRVCGSPCETVDVPVQEGPKPKCKPKKPKKDDRKRIANKKCEQKKFEKERAEEIAKGKVSRIEKCEECPDDQKIQVRVCDSKCGETVSIPCQAGAEMMKDTSFDKSFLTAKQSINKSDLSDAN